MTPAQRDYDRAALEMHRIELRIASLTRFGRPHPDTPNARILAAFEAARVKRAAPLAALKAAAGITDNSARPAHVSSDIKFPRGQWVPIGAAKHNHDTLPDIPEFLRRKRT